MRGASQFGQLDRDVALKPAILAIAFALALFPALPSAAQFHGPPTTVTLGGHFLAPPPSVTSMAGSYLPLPPPSVTSLPNYGFTFKPSYHGGYRYGYHRGRGNGYGYTGGLGYVMPYYIPVDASGYGYDYVAGGTPDLYSGPTVYPTDPNPHLVVEQPPARRYEPAPEEAEISPPTGPALQQPSTPQHDARPMEPTVLVFRDGHQQEVTNYAIMGQTIYVFGDHLRKIALADLDVPATIKTNDDRGMEFKIPASQRAQQKKSSDVQPKSAPDQNTAPPPNVAAIMP